MQRRFQRLFEKQLVKEFFENELKVQCVYICSKKPPYADCYLKTKNSNGELMKWDVEFTEYYIDAKEKGGSPMQRLTSCWEKVHDLIIKHFLKHKCTLHFTLGFKSDIAKFPVINKLATQLIDFAETCRGSVKTEVFYHFPKEFDLLNGIIESIRVQPVKCYPVLWYCSSTQSSFINIIPRQVTARVSEKNVKQYKWTKNANSCLIVAAARRCISSAAGPNLDSQVWQDPDLRRICTASQFQRVYFWERVYQWHHALK